MLRNVAATIPEAFKTQLREGIDSTNLSDVMEDLDTSGVTDAFNSGVIEAAENVNLSGVTEAFDSGITEAVNNADLSTATDTLGDTVTDVFDNADLSAATEAFDGAVTEAVNDVNYATITEALRENVTGAVTDVDFSAGVSVLKAGLEFNITEAISNPEISAAKEALKSVLGSGITEAISAVDLSAAFAALTAVRQQVEAQAQATLGAQMSVRIPVNLTYDYNVANPTPPKPTLAAQSATMSVGGRANGGFINGAELSWIGEDGPEAIIPLGMKRRERGLELYEQVGEILGVAGNAAGGVYGAPSDWTMAQGGADNFTETDERSSGETQSHSTTAGRPPVILNITMAAPQITIADSGGGTEEEIMRLIRKYYKEAADELCDVFAERLANVYENMPVGGD